MVKRAGRYALSEETEDTSVVQLREKKAKK